MRTLVWFRSKDLRVADHAALADAALRGEVVPLFVLDPFFEPERAARFPRHTQFLLESLRELGEALEALGSRLVLERGENVAVVSRLARMWRVDRVVAQRCTEPSARDLEQRLAEALHVPLILFDGETMVPPDGIRTQSGEPYAVFTPFARAFGATVSIGAARPPPTRLPPLPEDIATPSVRLPTLSELGITLNPRLLAGGERAANERLRRFLSGSAADYARGRDRLDLPGTSRLSQDLKFGTLSPRAVWRSAAEAGLPAEALHAFQNELLWREFTHAILWAHPYVLERPFRSEWIDFPYRNGAGSWRAWTSAATGYPIVDASQRQLHAEGFVHNRARMVSASFLTKHLLVHYRFGEAHYLELLTDGDPAQNNAGWQWSAGCGCDAQPYFRVFNPVTQGKKFDPDGSYVRRYVPELARLPARFIHAPWAAPSDVLRAAGIRLGSTYPLPIVDHDVARTRFLALAETHRSRRPSIATGAAL